MICYNNNENTLLDCLDFVDSFEIFHNGKPDIINKNNVKFEKLKYGLGEIFSNSRLMPAFGVSLHDETQNEMMFAEWLKVNFSCEQTKNGLKFNSLLFKLEEVQGFNLIRYFNNRYEGRCLYLDLDETINLKNIVN